ncbi:MAG TPA: lytic murein transglycosylase B [Rhodocyclaceae bacterium]|nr:lytic murein transglycosylase B [Rhodocyclaceae bacterium]
MTISSTYPHRPRSFSFFRLLSLYLLALSLFSGRVLAQSAPIPVQKFSDREDVRAFIDDVSARDGLAAGDLKKILDQVTLVPKVIDLIKPPTQPGVRSWQTYRARFIERTRIAGGIQFWTQHRAELEAAEARYGVPAEIIVAIIGVETIYGRNTGDYSTLSALATLAFEYPPRADLFRFQLEALILLAQEQGRSPLDYRGSYAGAIGLPQFLPSSMRNFAVDFDHDGRIDVRASPADAIGSVANFLAQHGWEKDGRIAVPAHIEGNADLAPLINAGFKPQFDFQYLTQNGIAAGQPDAPVAPVALIDLVTPNQPTEYWLGYQNFYVITRYNRSSFYAMAVADLAHVLRLEFDVPTARRDAP